MIRGSRPGYPGLGGIIRGVEQSTITAPLPDRADERFPLRLLSRVVVRDPVTWSMDALFACLACGLPIARRRGNRPAASAAIARKSHWLCCSTARSPSRLDRDLRTVAERQAIVEVVRLSLPE